MRKHFLLSALLLICALPICAYDFESNGICYNILDGDIVEVTYQDSEYGKNANYYQGAITIPATVDYNDKTYRVTAIDEWAFFQCTNITSVTIPESITSIEDHAFASCYTIVEITCLAKEPPVIYEKTFSDVYAPIYVPDVSAYQNAQYWQMLKLESIPGTNEPGTNEPDTNESNINKRFEVNGIYYQELGDDAVEVTYQSDEYIINSQWYKDSITIPATVDYNDKTYRVTAIGERAFNQCTNIITMTIPESITSIGEYAFQSCSTMVEITCLATIPPVIYENTFWAVTAPIYVPDISAYQNAPYWSELNIQKFPGKTMEIDGIYYEELDGDSVMVISGSNQYTGAVVIPAQVTDNGTVYRVTAIGERAFENCSELTSISISENVTSIGEYAFAYCSGLTSITIPENVTYIGFCAFTNCTPTTVIWNAKNCNLNIYNDWGSRFGIFGTNDNGNTNYSITTFTFGNTVETIPSYLCSGLAGLTSVIIPDNVTVIGEYSFSGCTGLTSLTIPNSVKEISAGAFSGCINIKEITIGTGLELLEYYAFAGCKNIKKFICNSAKAFEGCYDDFGPNGELDYAKVGDEDLWEYAMEGGIALTNTQIDTIIAPANFFDIGEVAWSHLAKNIQYIQITGGELTADAFGVINRSFDKLQTLDISAATNTEIANNAIKGCDKLETLLLPSQLETVGYMAFAECVGLHTLNIPATVTEIADRAFEKCSAIQEITCLATNPPTIAEKTFAEVNRSIPVYVQAESLESYKSDIYWSEFFNLQAEGETSISFVTVDDVTKTRKVLENGTIYILRGGKRYTLDGREVK